MSPERLTITVSSNLGEDGPLTVSDGLRQVLDFFELLAKAQSDESRSVDWRLVSVSKNSPLRATAEAYAVVPGVDVSVVARQGKRTVYAGLSEITSGGNVPGWMDSSARNIARNILSRNVSGVGRTDIDLEDNSPVLMLVSKRANIGLAALEKVEAEILANEPDLSRSEIGSLEGNVAEATTYKKQPALRIRDRRTGAEVLCVFSDELAQRTADHIWKEVWEGVRVRIYGRIQFNRKGLPANIRAEDITEISPRDLDYSDIADPNFTGGLEPVEYLAAGTEIA